MKENAQKGSIAIVIDIDDSKRAATPYLVDYSIVTMFAGMRSHSDGGFGEDDPQ
jgi:hypothetical protein